MAQIRVERLDHLGVIASVIQDLGLIGMIDTRLVPDEQEVITPGEAVAAMILNGLGFANRVVLENNNGHLTQLSAERLLLFRVLLPSRQEVLVSCPWAGLGEPGSADEQSVRPSAW
jgi:hypothetical protein